MAGGQSRVEEGHLPWLTLVHGFSQNGQIFDDRLPGSGGAGGPGFDMPAVASRLARARSIARPHGIEAAMEDWFRHADRFEVIRAHPDRYRADEHLAIVCEFSGHQLLVDFPVSRPLSVEEVESIRHDVLVYYGAEDIDDFKESAAWLSERLPRVTTVEIPDQGGFPAWESPQAVNGTFPFRHGTAQSSRVDC